jgi:hypothetical protein
MFKHCHHPEIDPFYRDAVNVETCKRGGKKRKQKTKTKGVTNQNIIKINIGSDKGKSKYAQMNHVTRLQRNARPMANPPSVSIQSSFAVPNPVAYPARHVEIGENSIPAPPIARVEVRDARGVPNFTSENPRGIVPVSSQPSRAVPSRLGNHGGVAYQAPEAIRAGEQIYDSEREDYSQASVSYFKPAGRDNLPLPYEAKHTLARPVDYFPLRGQDAVPVPEEIERMHESRTRRRSESPRRDEDFYTEEQQREARRRQAISDSNDEIVVHLDPNRKVQSKLPFKPIPKEKPASPDARKVSTVAPFPGFGNRYGNMALPLRRQVSLVSPSPAGRTSSEASSSMDGKKFGGMKKQSVF